MDRLHLEPLTGCSQISARREGARLRSWQKPISPHRGGRTRCGDDREQSHNRDRQLCAARPMDERYLDSPYYLVPNEPVGQEAFAVIRDAMRGKDMVALGRIVLAKRERVVMLQPWDKGLVGTTLRYPYEVRDTKDYFDDIPDMKPAKDMLQLAEHILETKAGDFEPESSK